MPSWQLEFSNDEGEVLIVGYSSQDDEGRVFVDRSAAGVDNFSPAFSNSTSGNYFGTEEDRVDMVRTAELTRLLSILSKDSW